MKRVEFGGGQAYLILFSQYAGIYKGTPVDCLCVDCLLFCWGLCPLVCCICLKERWVWIWSGARWWWSSKWFRNGRGGVHHMVLWRGSNLMGYGEMCSIPVFCGSSVRVPMEMDALSSVFSNKVNIDFLLEINGMVSAYYVVIHWSLMVLWSQTMLLGTGL